MDDALPATPYFTDRRFRTEILLQGEWIVADAPLTAHEAEVFRGNHERNGTRCRVVEVAPPAVEIDL